MGFPGDTSGKEPACQCRRRKRRRLDPRVRKIAWRREWQPTPLFLPGESHDRGAWWATVHGVTRESENTEATWHVHILFKAWGWRIKQKESSALRTFLLYEEQTDKNKISKTQNILKVQRREIKQGK